MGIAQSNSPHRNERDGVYYHSCPNRCPGFSVPAPSSFTAEKAGGTNNLGQHLHLDGDLISAIFRNDRLKITGTQALKSADSSPFRCRSSHSSINQRLS